MKKDVDIHKKLRYYEYVERRHIELQHVMKRYVTNRRVAQRDTRLTYHIERGVCLSDNIYKKYSPMTEATYYALLSLKEARHGYAIMQFIQQLTDGRIKMGTGTLYTMLGRLVEDNLINVVAAENGKKTYEITELGEEIVRMEIERLRKQLENGEQIYGK